MAKISVTFPYVSQTGTIRVILKLTHKGVRRSILSSVYLTSDEITKAKKIKSPSAQRRINSEVNKYITKLETLNGSDEYMSPDELLNFLTVTPQTDYIDFFEYSLKVIDKYRLMGKAKTSQGIKTAINSFRDFCGVQRLDINELTYNFLNKYQLSLYDTKRSKTLYLAMIRIVLNHAKDEFNDEDRGLVLVKVSPFRKLSTKYESEGKRAIDISLLRKVRDTNEVTINYISTHRTTRKKMYLPTQVPLLKLPRVQLAQDMFMLSFYLIGMNEVDLYKCTTIKGDILSYNRSKVTDRRDDKGYFEVRLEPEVMPLMRKYRGKDRVFNFSELYSSVGTFISAINKGLKYIDKSLTFYQARHTWATIAVNDIEADKLLVHEALNHADERMKITDKYVIKKFDRYWELNRKVIDYSLR